MKTDKNSRTTTTEGTQPKPELTVPDNNQRATYQIIITFGHGCFAMTRIKASSYEAAKRQARRFLPKNNPKARLEFVGAIDGRKIHD